MSRRVPKRRVIAVVSLVVVWCALWGEASVANVGSGLLIALVATAAGIGTPMRGGVRIVPLVRFFALVAIDLVTSTIDVAREIVTPGDRTDEAIIAVQTPPGTRAHLLLLIVAITVTPGTAVVDADPDSGVLYLHLLHGERAEVTRAHVVRLAALACEALPLPSAVLMPGTAGVRR